MLEWIRDLYRSVIDLVFEWATGRKRGGGGYTRNIMLTGYWPPTNDMLRSFSTDLLKNPDGWLGRNWRGRGYDIYAYFPEFRDWPSDLRGDGDFQVDYQRTSTDFWRIVEEIHPCAIITFSATGPVSQRWEIERYQRNLEEWLLFLHVHEPPNPSPPDASVAPDTVRESTLPMESIAQAVNASGIYTVYTPAAFIDEGFGGGYVSEFIAYHGVWYQALHRSVSSPHRCVAAGHIHVGTETNQSGVPWGPTTESYDNQVLKAEQVTAITLEQVIDHVTELLPPFAQVPRVRELPLAVALQDIGDAELTAKTSGDNGPGSWVWRQSPPPGSLVEQESVVDLELRTGPIP